MQTLRFEPSWLSPVDLNARTEPEIGTNGTSL